MLEEVADRIEEKASLPFRSSYLYGQVDAYVKGSPKYEKPEYDKQSKNFLEVQHNRNGTLEPGQLASFSVMQSRETDNSRPRFAE